MSEARFTLVDPEAAHRAAARAFELWRAAFQPSLPAGADIQHVGATSIPGALTKGDLDIAVRVAATDFAAAQAVLDTRHVQNLQSVRDGAFAAYEADGFPMPVGVQLVVRGSRLDVFERFRDALMSDPSRLTRYNALKQRFDGRPMSHNRAAKAAFIADILAP